MISDNTSEAYSTLLHILEERLSDAEIELQYARAKQRAIEDMIDEVRMILNHEIVI